MTSSAEFRAMNTYQKIIYIISLTSVFESAVLILMGVLGLAAAMNHPAEAETAGIISASITILVSSAVTMITAILGIRAAKTPSRINPVYVLAMISLLLSAAGLITAVIAKNVESRFIVNLVVNGLLFFAAWNLRNQVRTGQI